MRTFINRHWGELDAEVMAILEAHPEWWGAIDKSDLLHTDFYDVLDEGGNLVGFFGNAHWNGGGVAECVLCNVYVKEEFRRLGIFRKMVRFTVDRNPEAKLIAIGAQDGNELAKSIYSRMFSFSHHDEAAGGDWFVVRDRR